MAYKKIKSYKMTEEKLRELWGKEYCNWKEKPIYTFDRILVKFYRDQFNHIFYESSDWKKKDKSILSLNRCEKMFWIRDTLQDKTAILKIGYDNVKKKCVKNRRVAIVKGNYVVIILKISDNKAKFITAFEAGKRTLSQILSNPDWRK